MLKRKNNWCLLGYISKNCCIFAAKKSIYTSFLIKDNMKTKIRKTLSELCKDMGLTDKALDELSEIGAQGLATDASDEDIKKAADSLVPYAKLMQGEITRKTRKSNHNQTPKSDGDGGGEGEGDDAISQAIAKHLAPFKEQLDKLQSENDALKAEKAKGERSALIAAEAKKLGIPEYLMKRIAIADDADIAKELADFKQELVNNNLMPKGAVSETGQKEDTMKADAKAWAESLPNK